MISFFINENHHHFDISSFKLPYIKRSPVKLDWLKKSSDFILSTWPARSLDLQIETFVISLLCVYTELIFYCF